MQIEASGQYNHQLNLHAPEGTYGTGNPAPAVDIATNIPAFIGTIDLPFQLQERIASGGLNTGSIYRIQIRYRADVQLNMEWHEQCHNRRVFQIQSMIQNDHMTHLEMTCIVGQR